MNLRQVRVRLTVLYTVLAAVVLGGMVWYSADRGEDRIYESADREVVETVNDLAVVFFDREQIEVSNTWLVHWDRDADEYWQDPFGSTWVELPLRTIAEQSSGSPNFERHSFQGTTWLTYPRPVGEFEWAITAVDLSPYASDVNSLRWRLALAAMTAISAMAAIGYWLAGRSLEPARKAVAQQRDFIADAAHELRTPLAVIQASASHVLSKPRDERAYRESLGEILAAAERAGQGVGELLELARLDAGQARPRLAPLRVDLLAEEVAAAVRIDGVTIEATPGEALVADADYVLIRQVVENLVRNAAARSTMVHVTSSCWERFAVVQVGDDGPGFSPDVIEHVFDRFRRGDGRGSSGLGMAIARRIVEAHGGTIDAQNRPEGGGALVRFTLPLADD